MKLSDLYIVGALMVFTGLIGRGLGGRRKTLLFIFVGWLLTLSPLITGCATPPPPPEIIIKHDLMPPPKPVIPDDPYASLPSDIAEAIKHNETPTFHHGISTIYPYSPDMEYPLECQRLHVTQIRLRPDESTDKNNVKVGDRDRWGTIVGDHTVLIFPTGSPVPISVPGAQVIIPADPSMVTNLVIHTSAGNDYVFNPIKATSKKDFDQVVSFYYPSWTRQQAAVRGQLLKQEGQQP